MRDAWTSHMVTTVDTPQPYAAPAVLTFARQLGIDLKVVTASGPRGRILREDVERTVRQLLQAKTTPVALTPTANLAPSSAPDAPPDIDFARFGAIERLALSRIQRLSGPALTRNWQTIPHVTNFDRADITDLEAFRQSLNQKMRAGETKVTVLAFLMKCAAATLKAFPHVNASLSGTDIILKRYVHIGFAADTPGGLVVPVVRDCDVKGVRELANEIAALAARARNGKLKAAEMQGGCFSISSLGGIGGTGFTPIINAPEVAILGVARAEIQPVWTGTQFAPRLLVPLCLSWDHRAIDGALAARFLSHLGGLLGDLRRAGL